MGYVDNPSECKKFRGCNAQKNRNFYCNHYDNCLVKAIENNWNNFNCKSCWKFKYKDSMKTLYICVNYANVILSLIFLYSKK